MTLFKKATLATVLAATALTAATPAMARPYDRYRSNNSGAIVAGGIIGLALGAAIVSSSNHHNRDRYENRNWTWRDGAYWDREGHRYDRDGRRFDDNGYARRGYDRGYEGRGYEGRGYYGGSNYGGQYYGGDRYGY
ncbi:MAG: hypothetical protein JWQ16_907 [Novosphingobium sp.]|nr:hypothetical protein [Novosphingobium sp.]